MLNLIPLPYRILAAVLVALALFGGGIGVGHRWAANAAEADRAKEAKAALVKLNEQIARGNSLSDRLSKAESVVVTKTVEVIKHVPIVTTGRLCLGADAVSLLQPATDTAGTPPASPPVAESPPTLAASDRDVAGTGGAASDRDVAMWIAIANQQYEVAAARLNALIEWNGGDAE